MRRRLISVCSSRTFSALMIASACLSTICRAQVVINEVYYDHPGADDGWEFIELYNAGVSPCDLAGFRLEFVDGTSGRRSTVWSAPPGLSIEPGAPLCICGSRRSPAPALLLKGTLGNGPDAVRLVSADRTMDLVGYGSIGLPDLFESAPAADVGPGFSLARKPDGRDTDRNDVDFVQACPTPGGRNFFSHDLAIAVDMEGFLPCRGSPLSFLVRLVNGGLEPFSGMVSVLAEASSGGQPVSRERAERDVALPVSGSDSILISLPVPPADGFTVRTCLSTAPDENRSNDTAAVTVGTSPGEVIIHEIMYRPREGRSEWMELRCNRDEPCSLKGWTICDATGRKRVIASDDLVLLPGEFLILAEDSAAFAEEYPDCPAAVRRLEGSWPSLNDVDRGDAAETIEMFDSTGVLVERITYRNLIGSERGRSIERGMDSSCSSASGGIWHRSAAPAGSTPGRENSVHTEWAPQGESIRISPNPFCPRTAREAVISGCLAEGETGFIMRVFDLGGAEVRRLFGEDGGARIFSCRWDGRADDGSRVRTGLYVCLVEFVRTGGGVCRKEKKCIAVAAD